MFENGRVHRNSVRDLLKAIKSKLREWAGKLWMSCDLPFSRGSGFRAALVMLLTVLWVCGYCALFSVILGLWLFFAVLERAVRYVLWWWHKLLTKPIDALVFFLVILCLVAAASAGFLRVFRPETTVIISPFELTSSPPSALPVTGKTAANLLKDEVAEILDKTRNSTAPASTVSEPYGDKGQSQVRSVALGEGPQVSAVSIEVEGLSLEKIRDLFGQIRQDQRHIEGDVLFQVHPNRPSGDLLVPASAALTPVCDVALQARMPKVGSWRTASYTCDESGLKQAAHELAVEIFRDFSPNTLAMYLQAKGQREEAIQILRQLVAANPTDVRTILDLALALYNNSEPIQAIEELQGVLRLNSKFPEQIHNNLGLAMISSVQAEDAETEYSEAIRLNGRWTKPHNNLGRLLLNRGDLHGALRQFLEALRIDNDDAEAHDDYAVLLGARGQTQKALDQFREAVRLQPEEPYFHLDLGAEFEKIGNYDAAISEYRELIRLKPDEKWGYTDLGNALAESGDFPGAIEQHRKALTADPSFTEAHNNLGNTYELSGDFENALEQYSAALRINPDYIPARCNLARILDAMGEYEASIFNFKDAINRSVDDEGAALAERSFGDFLSDEEEFDAALTHYKKALNTNWKKDPLTSNQKDAGVYLAIAYIYDVQGEERKAIEMLEASNALGESADAHAEIGQVLEHMGRTSAAIEEYRKALSVDPNHSVAHRFLANALESEGDYDNSGKERFKARDNLVVAQLRMPRDWRTQSNLGNVLSEMGKSEAATEKIDAALDTKVDNVELLTDLGANEELRNNQEGAIEDYRLAIRLKPNYEPPYLNLGFALNLEGRHDEAIQVYQQAARITPNDPSLLTSLGLSYDDTGKFDASIEQHQLAIKFCEEFTIPAPGEPSATEAHTNLCRVLTHKGNYDLAIRECREALHVRPRFAEAHLNLGQALTAKSDHCVFCWKDGIRWEARKQFEYAKVESQGALKLRDDAESHFSLGTSYYGLGEDSKAIEEFRRALERKQIYASAHYGLALALRRSGQLEKAMDEFREANGLDHYLVVPVDGASP
jgi:tetratricopeptide (TPR) repeat protein